MPAAVFILVSAAFFGAASSCALDRRHEKSRLRTLGVRGPAAA